MARIAFQEDRPQLQEQDLGGVAGSYSADRIERGQPVREPFAWRGALWICTALQCCGGGWSAEAYRLVAPELFPGAAGGRETTSGFYHGVRVDHAGESLVLCGPPVVLRCGRPGARV